jgi:DNA-binding NarL/FixJ family response regulator
MKILIADDHPIFRAGLVKIIEEAPSFQIVAQTGDGAEALRLIKYLAPQSAVLDIYMHYLDGLEVVRQARQTDLAVKFIILTMYKEQEYFDRALELGIKGYILKENAPTDLVNCLIAVSEGRHYVSPIISDYLINRNDRKQALLAQHPVLNDLTEMERRILKLIAENKTSKEIAEELFISYRTVQNHRTNICNKLGFKGYNKLLQFALEYKSLL